MQSLYSFIIQPKNGRYTNEVSVGDKPGDKGYIANLKDNKPLDIYFHYIDFKNMKSDEKLLASKGTFSIGGGTIKANFSRLFG